MLIGHWLPAQRLRVLLIYDLMDDPGRRIALERICHEYHGTYSSLSAFYEDEYCFSTELNGDGYETLDQPPTALEFLRLARIARPVVIKGSLWKSFEG
jgi:hypothetical protein